MRVLFGTLLAAGLALIVVGAVFPGSFVLSLLGMLVVTGTAAVGVAASLRSVGPRAHY